MQFFFSKFYLDTLRGVKNFCWGVTLYLKKYSRRILIFAPIDSVTHVSFLSMIHFNTLTPLFFELSSKIKNARFCDIFGLFISTFYALPINSTLYRGMFNVYLKGVF